MMENVRDAEEGEEDVWNQSLTCVLWIMTEKMKKKNILCSGMREGQLL